MFGAITSIRKLSGKQSGLVSFEVTYVVYIRSFEYVQADEADLKDAGDEGGRKNVNVNLCSACLVP